LGGTVFSSSVDTISWSRISSEYFHSGYGIASIDTNIFIATQHGIYMYGGDTTWLPRNIGLPVDDTTYLSSCLMTTIDTLLFVYIIPYTQPKGIYVSSDKGEKWVRINDSSFSDYYVTTIAANEDYLFTGTQNGSWRVQISKIVTSVKQDIYKQPSGFYLYQNYPNPFNPSTTIAYQLLKEGFVTLKIYNILGCEVAALVTDYEQPGNYQVTFNAENLASGVYIYQLKVSSNKTEGISNYSNAKKLLLLK
jgi:Secretion system C-terminal sorting domain